MPIRLFWVMSGNIDRIRSENSLHDAPLLSTVMGGEHVSEVIGEYRKRAGNPLVVEQVRMTKRDEEKLRKHFG